MLIAIFMLLAAVLPIRINIAGEIHNSLVNVKIKTVFAFVIPTVISIYNSKETPLDFKVKLFGNEKDLNKAAHSKTAEETKDKLKKVRPLCKVIKYVKKVEVLGSIGLFERPDYSSVAAGIFNSLFMNVLLTSGIKKIRTCFLPEYGKDVFEMRLKCIISVNVVNIIKEIIRGYREMKYE